MNIHSIDRLLPINLQAVLALLVLVHVAIHVAALTSMWWPIVLALLLYPVVVDRLGLTATSTPCGNCGADNECGSLVCERCRRWLADDGGSRWLLLGGVVVPLLAAVVEVTLFGLSAALYSTPLGLLALVVYPYGMYGFMTITALLMLFGAGVTYAVVQGVTSRLLYERPVPILSR